MRFMTLKSGSFNSLKCHQKYIQNGGKNNMLTKKNSKLTRALSFLLAFVLLLSSFVIPGTNPAITKTTTAAELKEREAATISEVVDADKAFVSTEEYIKSNLNSKFIKGIDKVEKVSLIKVKSTLSSKDKIKDGDTIDSIMGNIAENFDKFERMSADITDIYDVSKNSEYYVALVGRNVGQNGSKILDAIYANDNMNGESLAGPELDKETGILYIPKSLKEAKKDETMLQAQLLYALEKGVDTERNIELNINGSSKKIISDYKGLLITFPIATPEEAEKINPETLVVKTNGTEIDYKGLFFNKEAGRLTIEMDVNSLQKIEVRFENNSLISKVKNVFSPKVNALTSEQLEFANPGNPFQLSADMAPLFTANNNGLRNYLFQGAVKGGLFDYQDANTSDNGGNFGYQYNGVGTLDTDPKLARAVILNEKFNNNFDREKSSGAAWIWRIYMQGSGPIKTDDGKNVGESGGLENLKSNGKPLFAPGGVGNSMSSRFIRLMCGHISDSAVTGPIGDNIADLWANGPNDYQSTYAMNVFARVLDSKFNPNGKSYITIGIVGKKYSGQSMFGIMKMQVEVPTGEAYFEKVDKDTKQLINETGGEFSLWKDNKTLIKFDFAGWSDDLRPTWRKGWAMYRANPNGKRSTITSYKLSQKSDTSMYHLMDLAPGTYHLWEKKAPNTYEPMNTTSTEWGEEVGTVTVVAGKEATFKAKPKFDVGKASYIGNRKDEGTIYVDKKITVGNQTKPLEGIVFDIFSDAAGKTKIGTMTTNSSGRATSSKLKARSTVYVKESPNQKKNIIPSGTMSDGITVVGGKSTAVTFNKVVSLVNKVPMGKITVYKEEIAGHAIQNGKNLFANSTFKVKINTIDAAAKAANPNRYGSTYLRDNTGKDIVDTFADGKISFSELPLGTYSIVEQSAGVAGVKPSPGTIDFTVEKKGTGVNIVASTRITNNTSYEIAVNRLKEFRKVAGITAEFNAPKEFSDKFYNYLPEGSVTITKIDADTKSPMQGVEFTLTGITDKTYSNKIKTNSTGIASFGPLVPGEYQLTETGHPAGYKAPTFSQKVVVNPNGTLNHKLTATNTPVKVQISVAKKDVEGKEVNPKAFDGVVFHVKSKSLVKDSVTTKDTAIEFDMTVNNGVATSQMVPLGIYEITEKSLPDNVAKNYTLNKGILVINATNANDIKVEENGNNTIKLALDELNKDLVKLGGNATITTLKATEKVFANKPKYGVIKIEKVESKYKTGLQGAIFNVSGGPDGKYSKDYVTGKDGMITTDPLRVGPYIITEKKPAPGFSFTNEKQFKEPINVTETTDIKLVVKGTNNYRYVENQRSNMTPFVFSKKSIMGTNVGESQFIGAKFELRVVELDYPGIPGEKQAGELVGVYITDTEGEFQIEGLPSGKYQLVEIEAPKGFTLNPNPIDIIAKWNGNKPSLEVVPTIDQRKNEEALRAELTQMRATLTSAWNALLPQEEAKTYTDEELGILAPGTPTTKPGEGNYMELVKLGRIVLDKVYDNKNELPLTEEKPVSEEGITFAIFEKNEDGSKGKEVDRRTTNKDGKIASKYLPFGTYIVSQINTIHENINKVEDMEVTISEHRDVIVLRPVNTAAQMSLRIKKVDEDTKQVIMQEGVTFEVFAAEEIVDPLTKTVKYQKDEKVKFQVGTNLISQLVTNSEGYTDTFNKLLAGKYYLKEIKGPKGYFVDENAKFEVTIPNESQLKAGVVNIIEVTIRPGKTETLVEKPIENKPQYGELVINKVAEQLVGWKAETKVVKYQENETIKKEEKEVPQKNVSLLLESITLQDVKEQIETKNLVDKVIYEVRTSTSKPGQDTKVTSVKLSEAEFKANKELSAKVDKAVAEGSNVSTGVSIVEEKDGVVTTTIVKRTIVKVESNEPVYKEVSSKKEVVKKEAVMTDENGKFTREVGHGKYNVYNGEKLEYTLVVEEGKTGVITVQLPPLKETVETYVPGKILDKTYGINKPSYKVSPLAGAKFELIAEKDIKSMDGKTVFYKAGDKVLFAKEDISVDGKVVYKKGEVISAPKLSEEILADKNKIVDFILTTPAKDTISSRVPLGEYKLVEVEAPIGFKKDTTENKVVFEAAEQSIKIVKKAPIEVLNERQLITFNVNKVLKDRKFPEGQSVSNVIFGLYTKEVTHGLAKDKLIDVANPDKNGLVTFSDVPAGTFYVKEISTVNGYILDESEYEMKTSYKPGSAEDVVIKKDKVIDNTPNTEDIVVTKVDVVSGKPLEGVKFKLWKVDNEGKQIPVMNGDKDYFTTDKDGKIIVKDLDEGNYKWEEIETLPGYIEENKTVNIAVNEDSNLRVVIGNNPTEMAFDKIDADNGKSVIGAHLSLRNEDGTPVMIDEDKYVVHKEGVVSKEANWVTDGTPFIVRGLEVGKTYKIVETQAPDGYATAEDVVFTVDKVKGIQLATVTNKYTDIRIVKSDWSSEKIVNGATLEVREVLEDGTLGEIAVDKLTGKEAKWTTGAGLEDGYIVRGLLVGKNYAVVETVVPEGYLKPMSNVTFIVANSAKVQKVVVLNEPIPELGTSASYVDGTKENLPEKDIVIVDIVKYDKVVKGQVYNVKGKLVDANDPTKVYAEGVSSFVAEDTSGEVEVRFTVDTSKLAGTKLVAFEQLFRVGRPESEGPIGKHEDPNDPGQTVYVPKAGTTAGDIIDNAHDALATKEVTIVDIVKYSNLQPNKEHKVIGRLMDKDTGKALVIDGKEVVEEVIFTSHESGTGTVEVRFTIDASKLEGSTLVAFEKIYNGIDSKAKIVAEHEDLEDKEQSVFVPKVRTTATVKADETSESNVSLDNSGNKEVAPAAESVTIVDVVKYNNLIVGNEYTVKGILMDKTTGKALLVNGKEVTAEKKFIPEEKDGFVELEFTFSPKGLDGKDLVVFEELFNSNAKLVGEHKDINDPDQTVHTPSVKTKAELEGAGKEDVKGMMKIIDRVTYTNLIVGKEYEVEGVLMDKETGKAFLVDGKEVKSGAKIVPTEPNGYVDIVFEVPMSAVVGKTIVVFEKVSRDGKEVVIHHDINDHDQTVPVPKAKTTAKFDSGMKDANPLDMLTIIDTVKYTNLIIGKEYTVEGFLMDKTTGKELLDENGNKFVSSATFVAEKQNGEIDIIFKVPGELIRGKSVVAFETVYNDGKVVAIHHDINDEDQTVKVTNPKVGTTANVNGNKEAEESSKITIIDRVEYKNLVIGKTYVVRGILMDKATGKALLVNGKTVEASAEFVAKTPDGFVDVEFTFNGNGLGGKELVVFEEVFEVVTDKDGNKVEKLVEKHEDINDKNQTVKIKKTPKKVETGDESMKKVAGYAPIGLAALAAAGLAIVLVSKKRKEEDAE